MKIKDMSAAPQTSQTFGKLAAGAAAQKKDDTMYLFVDYTPFSADLSVPR